MNANEANVHTDQLVAEMKLEKIPGWENPFFTGWKEVMDDYYSEPPKGTGQCVGQLVVRVSEKPMRAAYVNLPGFESGTIPQGACFEIGTERLTEPPTLEAMREMLQKGLVKLNAVVEEYRASHAEA